MQGGRNQNQDQVVIPLVDAISNFMNAIRSILDPSIQDDRQQKKPEPIYIYLHLAYRTTEAEIIKSIPKNEPLDRDSCKKLFKACKYMRKDKLKSLVLRDGEQPVNTAKPNDEYAFCVVTLKVNKYIPGLDRGVDTLKRLDGFLKLAGKAEIVEISPPLPPSSLEGKGFYKIA